MLNENDQIELLRIDDAITPTDSLRVVDEGDTLEIQIIPETEDMYFYIPLDEEGAAKVRDTIDGWLKKRVEEREKMRALPPAKSTYHLQAWGDLGTGENRWYTVFSSRNEDTVLEQARENMSLDKSTKFRVVEEFTYWDHA